MHRRPGLLHMRPQHLSERRVQQMRPRMIPPDRVAPFLINDSPHMIANRKRLLEQSLVRPHSLHRQHATLNLGDSRISIRRRKPPRIARLPARVAIKARLIEHHLHQLASFGRRNPRAVFDNSQNLRVVRGKRLVTQKLRLLQIAISRTGRFLAPALPTGARARLLFGAGSFEAALVK